MAMKIAICLSPQLLPHPSPFGFLPDVWDFVRLSDVDAEYDAQEKGADMRAARHHLTERCAQSCAEKHCKYSNGLCAVRSTLLPSLSLSTPMPMMKMMMMAMRMLMKMKSMKLMKLMRRERQTLSDPTEVCSFLPTPLSHASGTRVGWDSTGR